MILAKAGQHARLHLAVEIIHEEGTEDGNVVLVSQLLKQILKVHTGGHVSPFPQDIHHFTPPTNLLIAATTACLRDDVSGQPEEYRRVRECLTYKLRQQGVGVYHGKLTIPLRGFNIHTFGLQARVKNVPVRHGWNEYHSFAVGKGRGGKTAHRSIEKLLVLIQLHDMVAGSGS